MITSSLSLRGLFRGPSLFLQRGVRLGRVAVFLGVCLSPAALPALHAELSRMQEGEVMLGQHTTREGLVGEAADVVLDAARKKAYVVDPTRGRVLRFGLYDDGRPFSRAEAVLGKADFSQANASDGLSPAWLIRPTAACVDNAGRLWVADAACHRVLRFDNAWQKESGADADGVLGQPSFTAKEAGADANQLREPGGLAVDPAGNLYVSDSLNHRVLRFNKAAQKPNGAAADMVLGQSGFGSSQPGVSATRLRQPGGLGVMSIGLLGGVQSWLWVADTGNHRVLRFTNVAVAANGAAADVVLGQPDFTSSAMPSQATAARLREPQRLIVSLNRVWVSDTGHHRVVSFDGAHAIGNGAAADKLLGQGGFSGRSSGNGPGKLNFPTGVAMDATGRLWVCDAGNQRIVLHDNAVAKGTGTDADDVLGADSLTNDPARVLNPSGMAVDPATGKLFVADRFRHRVLRYADHRTLAAGAAPEAVFGQANFSDGDPSLAAKGMSRPHGLCVDAGGRLWVADTGNNRVLRFDNAATRPSGIAADQLLGQSAFGEGEPSLSAAGMNTPGDVAVDAAGRLWVSDAGNHRVLRFDGAAGKASGSAANAVLGQANFTTDRSGTVSAGSMKMPIGLHLESNGRLWVADGGNSRVLRFDNVAAKANGASADGVLGQPGFTTSLRSASMAGLFAPAAVRMDAGGRLWVGDFANVRIVRYDRAATRPNGAPADFLLGQEDWGFDANDGAPARVHPATLFFAADGALWVADIFDDGAPVGRVLRYGEPTTLEARCGLNAQGRFFITFKSKPQTAYRIDRSTDLKQWELETTLSASGAETTWTQSTAPSGRVFFRVVENPL